MKLPDKSPGLFQTAPPVTGAALSPALPTKDSVGTLWEGFIFVAILVGLSCMVYVTLVGRVVPHLLDAESPAEWFRVAFRPSFLWLAMGTVLLLFRTLLWYRYRAPAPAPFADAPLLTVVIPAYNEGPMVAKSIDSVANARYPRDRLEILVVDDGSQDDTWAHIEEARARHPGLVPALRFPKNKGKREALCVGFERARGEVVVTIDSDSVIEQDALLALAGPFSNPSVGAVAGKVAVYNRSEGLIPRMLHVRYALSFDLLRAVQSTYGTVYCCPGALAAYRTSVVREVLAEWRNQTFLGSRCTYGEDRAMTNYILERGYDTVYQRDAVVHTVVPTTYVRLCKMLLRWERSYVREELRFARIVWSRPLRARLIALFDIVIMNLRYPIAYSSLILLLVIAVQDPWTLARVASAIFVMSLFNMLYFLRTERSWAFLYGILYSYFSFASLFWIFPYAVVSVRSRSWLTR